MTVPKPARLRLSRRPGFDLQALSLAFNGLAAVNVSRSGIWGNPFTVTTKMKPGRSIGGSRSYGYQAVPTAADAVDCFRIMMEQETEAETRAYELRARLGDLRGRNLACWCKPGDPCHADVLLDLANA